jgi:4-hydroxythreonine-4-phosphate dehydrogenase
MQMSGPSAPSRRPLALTMGEPAGIGAEIAFKAWRARTSGPVFFLIDDPQRLERLARHLGWTIPVAEIAAPAEAASVFASAFPVLREPLAAEAIPGRPDPRNAGAVLSAIKRATALALDGQVAAVVTNPINKGILYDAGFVHPGHTEFLAELAGVQPVPTPVMMLIGGGLRVVPVTIHISLREALQQLTHAKIVETARIAATGLRRDFGIARPRLAVAGLNPHAGEGGALGREEIETIAPAVDQLRADGLDVTGPLPADTLFHAGARPRYDATICMYHDQALIPLKTLDFERGVNVTLGLPFVRTSPDHGTALGIAGSGTASEASLIAALGLADALARQRASAAAAATA